MGLLMSFNNKQRIAILFNYILADIQLMRLMRLWRAALGAPGGPAGLLTLHEWTLRALECTGIRGDAMCKSDSVTQGSVLTPRSSTLWVAQLSHRLSTVRTTWEHNRPILLGRN